MTCGQRIRREREKRRMSQEDLAERLEVSRQAVSKWESDASRPTKEKRERLSELFELPLETWNDPPGEEQTSLRRWKTATAVLAAALCLIMAGNLALFLAAPRSVNTEYNPPAEAAQGAEETQGAGVADLSAVFPETLELDRRRDYNFGNWPLGEYDVEPLLKDSESMENNRRWVGSFEHADGTTALELIWAEPREENETTFYNVYLLYTIPNGDGTSDWHILFRMAEHLREEWVAPSMRTAEFTNVLGYDGFRIEMEDRELSVSSVYYIIPGPDGVPRLMSHTVGSDAVEFDVDEDGENEIVTVDGFRSNRWEIIDTANGEEGAFVYTLSPGDTGVFDLRFTPKMGGFVTTDSQDAVLARYILRDGALVRIPMTDFSVLDYPDVAGTEIQFITDEDILSDGKEPDDVLYSPTGVRITHRQQAYLALQELYGLTGLTVERCYCAANEFGVVFSLLPDGFNQRSFFSMDFREDYGGSDQIPSIFIRWRELGNDWSPLSFAEAEKPESWIPESEALRWYYDRLNILATGEAAYTGMVYASFDALYLTNGDLYLGEVQDTEWGFALFRITGPYPGGEVRH